MGLLWNNEINFVCIDALTWIVGFSVDLQRVKNRQGEQKNDKLRERERETRADWLVEGQITEVDWCVWLVWCIHVLAVVRGYGGRDGEQ